MVERSSSDSVSSSLAGMRIWLSGAVPKEAAVEEGERIRDFVALFAREVFKRGGTIVHGSHPTIRDLLLAEAKRYRQAKAMRGPLKDFWLRTKTGAKHRFTAKKDLFLRIHGGGH